MTYTTPQDDQLTYEGFITFNRDGEEVPHAVYVDFKLRYYDNAGYTSSTDADVDPLFQALVDHMNAFELPDLIRGSFGGGKNKTVGQSCEPTV